MEAECLSFSQIPHTSRLFLDFLENFERVTKFYPLSPRETERLPERRGSVAYPEDRRSAMADILERQNRAFGAHPEVLKSIQRLRLGAAAIVSGQQVVLFGGPAYSLYKAVTAIKLAKELERSGTPAVPIFWLATQDHDFAEVSQVSLRSGGKLRTFAIDPTAVEGTPVGGMVLDAQAAAVAQEAAKFLGSTPIAHELAGCYSAGETLGGAFAKLFAAIFGSSGLILFDPSDEAVARLATPIYQKALEMAPELNRELLARDSELEGAGYHSQVKITNSSTLLFSNTDGVRTAIRRANGDFAIGQRKLKLAELKQEIADHPERFSGNALLRPVAQDFLLPTLAYIGGPAEVAYFAQVAVVYEKLLGRLTPILPRLSATLLDARDQRLLKRYKISLLDVLRAGGGLREFLASRSLPPELAERFQQASESMNSSLAGLAESLQKLDPTLADSGKHAFSKIRYQLERLRGRAARARVKRDHELSEQAATLSQSLNPGQELQERVIGGVSFISQIGPELIDRLYDAVEPACTGHQVLTI